MKKTKIILDIIMTITLAFLVVIYFTGNEIHEILGILFIIEFILHELLNTKPIVIMLGQFFKGTAKSMLKNIVIVDVLLTISMVLSAVSGIFITKYLFRIETGADTFWYITHTISSYLAVVFVLIHTFMHSRQIVGYLNGIFKTKYYKFQEYLFNTFLIICLGFLVNLFIKNETLNKIKNLCYLNKEQIVVVPETTNIEIIEPTVVVPEKEQIVTPVKVTPTTDQITSYLNGLRCDGCNKRCILTSPQCIIGERQAEIETASYIQNYVAN